MSISKEVFFIGESPVETMEEAKRLADKQPVLVYIDRWKHYFGKIVVQIYVYTKVYVKSKRNVVGVEGITDKLLKNDDISDYTFYARGIFNSLKESDRWVANRINEIRKARMKFIMDKKDKNKVLSEYILIE